MLFWKVNKLLRARPMWLKKVLLYFNTIKYLKWSQIFFRFYRRVKKPKVKERFNGQSPVASNCFVCVNLFDEKIKLNFEASFLSFSKQLNLPMDWNDESYSKLWTYNLHYFEDLIADNAIDKHDFHLQLLDLWIQQNLEGQGNGWEPYPTSLRISNVLKAWLAGLPLERRHFASLYAQASFLSNNLEKHLLGNHYFANLKALLFAGIIFDNNNWLNTSILGLLREIREQILEDGGNFELSPMYHSIMLVDMLDMYNLLVAYPKQDFKELNNLIKNKIPKMIRYMNLMAHNDGGVSFFNDSVDGISPSKSRIEDYARKLGFDSLNFDPNKSQVINLNSSGYMIAAIQGAKLIFDAAEVGPDYIPGHAHADTLSFELSIGNERVFVNSGISQYGHDEKRIYERKTAAHNTVEINKLDSTEVWSGFRVAKRARVIARSANFICECAMLTATHDGYFTIYDGPLHERELCLGANNLSVKDELIGSFKSAVARFFFHPDLCVTQMGDTIIVIGQSFEMKAKVDGMRTKLVTSQWHPRFGKSKKNVCLQCEFLSSSNSITFSWVIK